MALLPVLTLPDPILNQKSVAVDLIDEGVQILMDRMLETMYQGKGVGLAAVQVGVLKRILVIDLQNDDDLSQPAGFYPLFMVNPQITGRSAELNLASEGCLSVPEQKIEVARPASITIRFLDYQGKQQEFDAQGWLSRVIQHEIDHLDGRLIVSYLSPIKRNVALRRLSKLKKHYL